MNQTSNDTLEIIMEAKTKVWLAEDGKPIIGGGKVELLKAIDEEKSLRKSLHENGYILQACMECTEQDQ